MKKAEKEFKSFVKWKMLFTGITCIIYISTLLFSSARQLVPAFLVGLMLALMFAHDLITGLILVKVKRG